MTEISRVHLFTPLGKEIANPKLIEWSLVVYFFEKIPIPIMHAVSILPVTRY